MPKAVPSKSDKDRSRPGPGWSAKVQDRPNRAARITPAGSARLGGRVSNQVLPHTVPAGLLMGEPTLLPYSVQEPS